MTAKVPKIRSTGLATTKSKTDLTPYDLVTAAGMACEQARAATTAVAKDIHYDRAERFLRAADVMRGLDHEPGYEFRPLAARGTKS